MYNSFVESEKENKELREENEALRQKVKDYESFLQKLRIYVLEREYNNSLMALKEVNRDMKLKIGGRREAYNNIIEYIKGRTDE